MRKIYDIRPPRSHPVATPLDMPPPKVAKDLSSLLVQGQDLHAAAPFTRPAAKEEIAQQAARPFGQTLWLAIKHGGLYLLVGLMSFAFFSALFYGYNKFQEQRAKTGQSETIAGSESITLVPRVSLRILNGSGSQERLTALRDMLESRGYKIQSVGTAAQPSDKSIIYFKGAVQEEALAIVQAIAPFEPILAKNDDLTGPDDIVILLGSQPPVGGGR